jgi:hypothetical protein
MGINSGSLNAWDYIRGRGLTIDEYGNEGLPKLFLGDLTAIGLTGYGLYSDNVRLNGSLTTKTVTGTYAGINTLSGVSGNKNVVGTDAKIIFWAGAIDTTDNAIRKAPFQVTENGYVYLKNSLFAGGIITGTELRAASIRGWHNSEESALTIYDSSAGIKFKTDSGEKSDEIFTIDSGGLSV